MDPDRLVTVSGRKYRPRDIWGYYLLDPADENNLEIPVFAARFPVLDRKSL